MEKVINIAGKNITLKSTGSLPIRYKQQFKTDFFADIGKAQKTINPKNPKELNMDYFDSETYYKILWVMAKTADPDIPPLIEWIDSFENGFPFMDILVEVQDLIAFSVSANVGAGTGKN